jgi:hypothetical protein
VDNLLWFHAFDRKPNRLSDVIAVLENGATAAGAASKSRTSGNEERLKLPASAYAYLGRGTDQFGVSALTLPLETNLRGGKVSPFDTGGLVAHIAPVNGWADADKAAFVAEYTWPCTDVKARLKEYPTQHRLAAYLDGSAPHADGPHRLWTGREGKIWNGSGNTWQAWTWELRIQQLPAGRKLKHWTAPNKVFQDLMKRSELDEANAEWYEFLAETYVAGGVSQLIKLIREEQES